MEHVNLAEGIEVYSMPAKSFPDCVLEAHQALHGIVPFDGKRNYFGLSRPEHGTIVYKAAAEVLPSDPAFSELARQTIPEGEYLGIRVEDFRNDIKAIGEAFQELIHRPGIDPEGYCVEWYQNNDTVVCMVKLAASPAPSTLDTQKTATLS